MSVGDNALGRSFSRPSSLRMAQADKIAMLHSTVLRLGGPAMATIQKWGNSLAVRIPAALAEQLCIQPGTPVEIVGKEGMIVVKPQRRRAKYQLDKLLKNCKPSQLHGEMDLGPDVGREVLD